MEWIQKEVTQFGGDSLCSWSALLALHNGDCLHSGPCITKQYETHDQRNKTLVRTSETSENAKTH